MNKKSLIGYAPWGALTILAIGFSLHTYFSNPKYQYTKPKEIISEVVKERKINSNLETQIKDKLNYINQNIDKKEVFDYIFFDECYTMKEQAENDIRSNLLKDKLNFDFKYLRRNTRGNLTVGVALNGKPAELYGTSPEDLHFECDLY